MVQIPRYTERISSLRYVTLSIQSASPILSLSPENVLVFFRLKMALAYPGAFLGTREAACFAVCLSVRM